MATPVLTKVLGNNSFYTESYIKDSVNLIKSIVIKNHQEAKLYNEYLALQIPGYQIPSTLTEWRYYYHLSGDYHPTDIQMTLVSIDNGSTITLNKASLLIHKKTKVELLKFDLYYDKLIAKYPQQQLLIRSIITTTLYTSRAAITALPDYSIVSYDNSLIEENEFDVMPNLQDRINNYKHIWLLPYYQNSDNLFIASQYHILYAFLFTSLLSIRLKNAKTMSAHSFHIRLYLASHFNLDSYQIFLSRRQQLYLYRNLLYFANHSGMNHVFRTLIDQLYNENNISVVSYVYNQKNTLDPNHYTNYAYNQQLLNSKSLYHSTADYSLTALAAKESLLSVSNQAEYTYNSERIDRKNKNTRHSRLLTKDLETILVDETDSVRYKLLETVTDYLAFLLKHNLVNFLTTITDPVTNATVTLNTADVFKLYCISLYAMNGVSISEFPVYRVKRVFAPILPAKAYLLSTLYRKDSDYPYIIDDILHAIPRYSYLMTSSQFTDFVAGVYSLDIGLWELLCNQSEMHTNGQFKRVLHEVTVSEDYTFSDETVAAFLSRVNVPDPRAYDKVNLSTYTFSILDEVFDKRLSYLNRLKKLQASLNEVFFKFNSYSVQLLDNYYNDNPLLVGVRDCRYSVSHITKFLVPCDTGGGGGGGAGWGLGSLGSLGSTIGDGNNQSKTRVRDDFSVDISVTNTHSYKESSVIDIKSLVELDVQVYTQQTADFLAPANIATSVENRVKNQSSIDLSMDTQYQRLYVKLTSSATIPVLSSYDCTISYRNIETNVVGLSVSAVTESQVNDSLSNDPVLMFLATNPV